jgi:hypothetical protein
MWMEDFICGGFEELSDWLSSAHGTRTPENDRLPPRPSHTRSAKRQRMALSKTCADAAAVLFPTRAFYCWSGRFLDFSLPSLR